MLVVKGRSKDKEAMEVVDKAIFCKAFGCLPSQLDKEDYEELVKIGYALKQIVNKNPMFMFA